MPLFIYKNEKHIVELIKKHADLVVETVRFFHKAMVDVIYLMWTSHIQDYKDIFLQTKVCAYCARKSVLRYH